jgi:predicted component of type VI protein secretion system
LYRQEFGQQEKDFARLRHLAYTERRLRDVLKSLDTLDEWFDPKGVEACEQKSILMLLAIAGISGKSDPLPL